MRRWSAAGRLFTLKATAAAAIFISWAGLLPAAGPTQAENARLALIAAVNEEPAWTKVHAAEALLAEGVMEPVRAMMAAEPEAGGGLFPRIGLWRMQINLAPTQAARAEWIKKVEAVFLDPVAQPDRLQALETLGKVQHRPEGALLLAVRRMAVEAPEKERVMAQWSLVLAEEPGALAKLTQYLFSKEPIARQRAAYALRWLKTTDQAALAKLARAAASEPEESPAKPYLVSAAFVLKAAPEKMPGWQSELEQLVDNGDGGVRFEACQALMTVYRPEDLGRLTAYFHAKGDSRIGPAWAVLHVMNRATAQ